MRTLRALMLFANFVVLLILLITVGEPSVSVEPISLPEHPTLAADQTPTSYTDPLYRYTLTLPPGWYALPTPTDALFGSALFANYDIETWQNYQELPPHGIKIQIGVGPLNGKELSAWTTERITHQVTPEGAQPRVLAPSATRNIRVGSNTGLVTVISGPGGYAVTEIEISRAGEVLSIGITASDLSDLWSALGLLTTLSVDENAPKPPAETAGQTQIELLGALRSESRALIPSAPLGACAVGTFSGNEAGNSPIQLWMPFPDGQRWTVGRYGSFYGSGYHCNSNNDYYATDWTRSDGGVTYGSAVLPVASGIIVGADPPPCPSTGYGCYVKIDHGSGIQTLYAHLSGVKRTSGSVNHWDQIGRVGSTGNATGPHLHLRFASGGHSHCWNNGRTCPNGEPPISPQSPKPSPMNTQRGSAVLVSGSTYVSNNKQDSGGVSCATPTPGTREGVLFADRNYGGNCVKLGIGEYPNPSYLGSVGNDNTRSVRVGSEVKAVLCRDDNYQGGCDEITGNVADLTTRTIGSQTSSVKVQLRGKPPSVPSNPSPSDNATLERTSNIVLSWSVDAANCAVHVWGAGVDINPKGNCSSFALGNQHGGSYNWQVTATNPISSTQGPVWHFNVKPYEPTNLSASGVLTTQIDLKWTASSDEPANVDGYHIYFADGKYIGAVGKGVTAFSVTGQTCNAAISFYVKTYRQNIESNPSNTASATTLSCVPLKPNLHPYAPTGYPAPVVPSSVPGTRASNTLYAGAVTYFDWHFINDGNAAASNSFYVELWIDNQRIVRYPYSNYKNGKIGGFDDWAYTVAQPGTHIVKLITDADNTIDEADKNNKVWQQQFNWQPIAGWRGEYYRNPNLEGLPWLTRDDAEINFNWALGSLDPLIPPDNFSVRWTRTFYLNAGTWRFTTATDDGVRLRVDGVLLIDKWIDQPRTTYSGDIALSAGNHTVEMEYYEHAYLASAQLSYALRR